MAGRGSRLPKLPAQPQLCRLWCPRRQSQDSPCQCTSRPNPLGTCTCTHSLHRLSYQEPKQTHRSETCQSTLSTSVSWVLDSAKRVRHQTTQPTVCLRTGHVHHVTLVS